jgi:hypothetical protein
LPMIYAYALRGTYEAREYCARNSTPVFNQTYIISEI